MSPYRTGTPCVQGSNTNGNCPDNAGLSHMTTGEPDDYPNGMPVNPYFPYLSYSVTGEWFKYTVQVLEAGTYSISGLDGAPRPPQNDTPTVSLDFGGGIVSVPAEPGDGGPGSSRSPRASAETPIRDAPRATTSGR